MFYMYEDLQGTKTNPNFIFGIKNLFPSSLICNIPKIGLAKFILRKNKKKNEKIIKLEFIDKNFEIIHLYMIHFFSTYIL